MRSGTRGALIAVAGIVAFFLAGPRPPVDAHLRAVTLPSDLDAYLAQSEARYTDIVPGTEKKIVWANAAKNRTPLSIIYLHGFSATRKETEPLCDSLAARLGANLYYSRLTGHGRGSAAMGEATVNDWLNDAEEALEIGKRLGERVIVIGTSTGATLAAWLAEQPQARSLRATVLISPNFGPRDAKSEMLTWPWARQWVPWVVGAEYRWTPLNAGQGRYWTTRYPSTALPTMMALVKYVRSSDLRRLTTPTLVMYSPYDQVLDVREIERRFAQIGATTKQLVPLAVRVNPSNHVLAGDIVAPTGTRPLLDAIVRFVTLLR